MLCWNSTKMKYSSDETPEFGNQTLEEFYKKILIEGLTGQELGHHKFF